MSEVNFWTYFNTITKTKKDIWEEGSEKVYSNYQVNRLLSNFTDSIIYANEVNLVPRIPAKWHYYYMLNSLRSNSRFSGKKEVDKDLDNIVLVAEAFKCNTRRAKEYLKLLSKDQLDVIKKRLDKGGSK